MIAINAHFDGKMIAPDEPPNLPLNTVFRVRIGESAGEPHPRSALAWLEGNAIDDDLPANLSGRHDCYLYGSQIRPPSIGNILGGSAQL